MAITNNGGAGIPADGVATLTNKVIDGASNTLTVRLANDVSGTLPLANGGTAATSAPAAMASLMGYTTTATAAGTTTFTNTSSYYQQFTGVTTQTIVLPVTSTLALGWSYHIVNNSTGNLTVQSSGLNTLITITSGTTSMVTCILTSGTTAASWEAGITDFSTYTGTGAVVLGTSPTLVSPVLGTPSSGTLTNATGLPISGLLASTSTALGVGSVELGHATDTTIARVSAGVASIEGVNIVTTSSTDTLTNKTINAPVIISPEERVTVSATAAATTVQFDVITQGVLYYTSNATANWALNVRGNSGTTLTSGLSVGDSCTISFLVTTGATAYYLSSLTIDGNAQTVKWTNGTAPTAGNASSVDAYQFTIVKTAATPTYTVFGSGPIKYA
jgi:hypothetical protein